nr:histone-lysine N-methyltransferase ATXR7 isoform X1 [Tanacetum cinerariifolium]
MILGDTQSTMDTNSDANGSIDTALHLKDDTTKTYTGYAQPGYVSGWMYVNEQGTYCGDTQSTMDTNSHANGSIDTALHLKDDTTKTYTGYAQPGYVSGWMYVNEQGTYCGPYIQEQLYEGLSTNYLPEELHVYPVINGNLGNPVPLKYFRQYPDHVATGFVYLSASASSIKEKSDKYPHVNIDDKIEDMCRDAVSTSKS